MTHSNIVGGSTAKRVLQCPGSVTLCQKAPPKPSSKYADDGTKLHDAVHQVLSLDANPDDLPLGVDARAKLDFAIAALGEIDPDNQLEFQTECRVHFGDFLANVFGSCDLLGRLRSSTILVDWKFGDWVQVFPEENDQLLFYAAAAMRTPETKWAFEGTDEVKLYIVQPPSVRVWTTTKDRIQQFERDLYDAVQLAFMPNAPLNAGDWCRWCAAKAMCPLLSGEVERALKTQLNNITPEGYSNALVLADRLEDWIKAVREMAQQALENNIAIPGFKLVPKRAIRQWVDEEGALEALRKMGLDDSELIETSLISPAKAEKALKKHKLALPKDHVAAISSGNTIAPESDPRPSVVQIGTDIRRAFSKLEVK